MRRIFNDFSKNNDIIHQGYTHHQLLSETESGYLLGELCKTYAPPQGDASGHNFVYTSYMQDDLALRQFHNRLIREVFAPYVEQLLDGYQLFSAGFFIKPPGGGEVGMHAHPLVVDSLQHTVVDFWCPLEATTVTNGTFHAVPGSHKIFPEVVYYQYRPFYEDYVDLVREKYSVPLPSEAGQAVIFDGTMLHWSPDNLTDKPRYAVHCSCIPLEARPTYFYFDKAMPHQFEIFEASPEFFLLNVFAQERSRPTDMRSLGTLVNPNRSYTRGEFEERMRKGDEIRRQLAVEPEVRNYQVDETDRVSSSPPPVFKDPLLEEQFHRDGYVVIPLLTEEEVQQLSALHDACTPDLTSDFYATVHHPNHEHRRQVRRAIDVIVQPRILPLLAGYKPVSSAFISKRGATKQGKIGMHQDYTFVDQSRYTGMHAWIPLVDVDKDNGCMTVYPGTHSLINHISSLPGPSASYTPSPYDAVRDLLEEKCGVVVPMAAGSALLFNERVLHSSGENVTPGKRVVVAIAFVPEQEPLYAYCPSPHLPHTLDMLKVRDITDLELRQGIPQQYPYAEGLTHVGTIPQQVQPLTPEQIRPLYNRQSREAEEQTPDIAVEESVLLDTPSRTAPGTPIARKAGLMGWLSRLGR